MRFALLGDHPDGLDMARALTASGQHQLLLYAGPPAGLQTLQRFGASPRSVNDLEEVLADHEIDAVIVASSAVARPAHLRRAMQSDCHVLCVHPAGSSPDIAYEASMIQADTGKVLLPLLSMTFHLGITRLAERTRSWRGVAETADSGERMPAAPRLLELEIWATEAVLLDTSIEGQQSSLPGWDVLRLIGGEIGEVFLLTSSPELLPGQPCLISGRFLHGGLFQATYLPHQSEERLRLSLVTTTGRTTVLFPQGWPGPAELTGMDEHGVRQTESWEALHPWTPMVARFEQAVMAAAGKKPQPGQTAADNLTQAPPRLGWLDELRALELDDAGRRSAARGRSSLLEFQESTEAASFKGTMTLLGCGLIWLSLIVLILATWIPWLVWLIVPVFGVYLLMQFLRWIVPGEPATKDSNLQP